MQSKELVVTNALGIHARAAARLVTVAGRFRSRITLCRPGREEQIDCKSILGVLMLAAAKGTRLLARCEGEDEEAALAAIEALFLDQFSEGPGIP